MTSLSHPVYTPVISTRKEHAMSILSLCSGYGGLELAIQATFRVSKRDTIKWAAGRKVA